MPQFEPWVAIGWAADRLHPAPPLAVSIWAMALCFRADDPAFFHGEVIPLHSFPFGAFAKPRKTTLFDERDGKTFRIVNGALEAWQ